MGSKTKAMSHKMAQVHKAVQYRNSAQHKAEVVAFMIRTSTSTSTQRPYGRRYRPAGAQYALTHSVGHEHSSGSLNRPAPLLKASRRQRRLVERYFRGCAPTLSATDRELCNSMTIAGKRVGLARCASRPSGAVSKDTSTRSRNPMYVMKWNEPLPTS